MTTAPVTVVVHRALDLPVAPDASEDEVLAAALRAVRTAAVAQRGRARFFVGLAPVQAARLRTYLAADLRPATTITVRKARRATVEAIDDALRTQR